MISVKAMVAEMINISTFTNILSPTLPAYPHIPPNSIPFTHTYLQNYTQICTAFYQGFPALDYLAQPFPQSTNITSITSPLALSADLLTTNH